MTFHEFEDEVRDTLAKYVRDKSQRDREIELILGLYEEGAEVTSIIRRSIRGNFHETKIDFAHLSEEIGDVIWYIAHIGMQLDLDLDQIALANLQKVNRKKFLNYDADKLTIKDYQQNAITAYRHKTLPSTQEEKARYLAMGMIKEIGEVSELFGENILEYAPLYSDKVKGKLGDTLWYLAEISETYDLNLETIASKTIQKTKARYNKEGIAQIPSEGDGR
ncbi:MAG: hypothetical protein IJE68_05435 [Clostridia bacterium]|nr:hypothetical protein [Clostridia bacterium]